MTAPVQCNDIECLSGFFHAVTNICNILGNTWNTYFIFDNFIKTIIISVWDVTLMSDQSVALAKWMPAIEQVTVRHLVNGKMCQISDLFCERHLNWCHGVALG